MKRTATLIIIMVSILFTVAMLAAMIGQFAHFADAFTSLLP